MGPFEIAATNAITTPYEFEPFPISTPSTPPLLPDFAGIDFVNLVGSSALTLFSILELLEFIGILVLIIIALRVLWWIYGLVTGQPAGSETLNVSGGIETAADVTGDESIRRYSRAVKKAKKIKNPFKL